MYKIKNFIPRLYQESILHTIEKDNTLTVLGTGLGKTKIAILVAITRLNNFPESKVLFLTPTKPLANQIKNEYLECTNIKDIQLFTGQTPPNTRKNLYKNSKIIISTPQTISNDIINNRIDLNQISLLIVDESHRAVKDYDYVWIAQQYNKKAKYPRILGLTASPGSDVETINEICKNLYIKEIEVRTEEDPDVKPYIQKSKVDWIKLDFPEKFKQIRNYLKEAFKSKLEIIKNANYIYTTQPSKTQLLQLQRTIQGKIARGEKDFIMYKIISITSEAIKIQYAQEQLETQGIPSAYKYMEDIYSTAEKTKTKATKNLAKDINFKSAYILTKKLYENNEEHPKLTKLKEIIKEETNKNKKIKIIVFNQYRESAKLIEKELNNFTKAKLFVGQTKKAGIGLTQKEQIKILDEFSNNKYNVLISTSIGEEGLDIPKVDLVIFYEPIPSAIRTIQRRGRTARLEEGKIIVLMTKNTRDEQNHWISHNKEKRMYSILKNLKERLTLDHQPKLKEFEEKSNLKIYVDHREKASPVVRELINQNINIETKSLPSADYIVSERVGIEFKTKEDFLTSIIDKRLLQQLKELRQNFEIPLIILQGEEDIYSLRRIHPNAIMGMLATIAISYNVPILQTKNPIETANLLKVIAKREQEAKTKDFGVNLNKKPLTTKELQEFVIESLPTVGPTLAKNLLKKFKTIKKIINTKNLHKAEGISKKRAEEITKLLQEVYEED